MVVNVAVDENQQEQTPKKKRKRSKLGCVLGVGLISVLFLGLAVGAYYFLGGYIADSAWKTIKHEDRTISIKMPGDPVRTVDDTSRSGTDIIRYTVDKPLAFHEFSVAKYEMPAKDVHPESLDRLIDEAAAAFCSERGGSVEEKKEANMGPVIKGKEARINLSLGRYAILRCYIHQPKNSSKARVYELVAVGPFLQSNKGSANQFLNSFSILFQTPPGAPGGPGQQAGGQAPPQGEQRGGQPRRDKKQREKI
jgi:hypothetical protein